MPLLSEVSVVRRIVGGGIDAEALEKAALLISNVLDFPDPKLKSLLLSLQLDSESGIESAYPESTKHHLDAFLNASSTSQGISGMEFPNSPASRIRPGVCLELDQLRELYDNLPEILTQVLAAELGRIPRELIRRRREITEVEIEGEDEEWETEKEKGKEKEK
eukprot:CAMPEP_0175061772 /NCGR_PEP_ID=MMETSP0052_2-20121109/13777_1 /TAXON_ID=51329 ORGANISM="Polytomella parva, Strain SAG 63-3" /NCGR_SAMPLE_ID=MMETSP0052_2 /ASSEMBLY_ACC=CAM_ASM_000194 /LENGTH=162 /DNA_ID=CAMNT_0016327677 /DNA_START=42 /DNA_END=527 /DNA_ORIENTATION=-